MIKNIFILVVLFIFSGCSIRNYTVNKAKIIIIKSPQLRFADLGYIRHNANAIELQVFEAGTLIKTIKINHMICVNHGCLTKDMFNKEYLNTNYPSTILKNIILANKIYKGKNIKLVKGGFMQIINNNFVDIIYSVIDGTIKFEDKKNKIFIKISPIS